MAAVTKETTPSWAEVRSGIHRSDLGVIHHKKKGWYCYRNGERAGRLGPFQSLQECKDAILMESLKRSGMRPLTKDELRDLPADVIKQLSREARELASG